MKTRLVPGAVDVSVCHRAPCLQWICTDQSQADPLGSLQAFGKLRVMMGLQEYLTSKSSSGGCCGAELESWT